MTCECGSNKLRYYGRIDWTYGEQPEVTWFTVTCLDCGKSYLYIPEKEKEQ